MSQVVIVLQRYRGGYQRGAAQGKWCRGFFVIFLGESANICGDQAAPGLELVSLACFEPIAWRLRSSGSLCYGNGSGAPKAHTARRQLCCSTLTSFIFCAKASFKTVNETGPASAEKPPQNIALGFNLNAFTPTQEGNRNAFTLGGVVKLVILRKWLGLQPDILLS